MTEEAGYEVEACTRCEALAASRSQIVDAAGPADADLLFVGEAPGADEDENGEPFVGRSGDVLDEALLAAGLGRDAVRITNCVRCRPPDNRDPHVDELANCRGHLDAEVAAVDPELLVTLGKVPAEHLLETDVAITAACGDVREATVGGQPRSILLALHPAATLYDRSQADAFEAAIEHAADLVATDGGQARIGEF